MHGDLGQIAREKALASFRSGQINVLVATDVAARGIDIDDVTHVINYQCPEDDKTYVHRIGRTGRAGRTGIAVTLVDWDDIARWQLIDKALGLGVPEPDETYSTSPHLFTELNIAADVTGSIGEKFSGGPKRREPRGERAEGEKPKRTRTRRRTRAGQPTDESAAEAPAPEAATADGDQQAPARRRRRRRRPNATAATTASA
ncbi:Probable ATP-dependent DEAD-box RNA helicase [Mycobacteroides abscessus]|nr:Probable ATP-dependent DEAD-box RNA helicase [Mycobacteroides abscessus]